MLVLGRDIRCGNLRRLAFELVTFLLDQQLLSFEGLDSCLEFVAAAEEMNGNDTLPAQT